MTQAEEPERKKPERKKPERQEPQAAAKELGKRDAAFIIAIVIALAALGQMGVNIVLPALPQMSADLGVATGMELILSTFLISFASGMLITGPLSDQIGRKPVIVGGLVVFFIASIVTAFANDFTVLMIARVAQGFGAAAGMSVGRAVARDLFDGPRLVKVYSILTMAMALVPALAPAVGGIVVQEYGWRMALAFPALVTVVLLAAVLLILWETHPPDGEKPTFSAVAVGYKRVLSNGTFLRFASTNALTLGALYCFAAAAPAHFIDVKGYSPAVYGVLPIVTSVFYVIGASLAARFGQNPAYFSLLYRSAAAIQVMAAAGLVWLSTSPYQDIVPVMSLAGLFTLGMGVILPLGVTGCMQPFKQNAGAAAAMLGAMQMGCGALGSAVVAAIPFQPLMALGLSMAVFAVIGALVAFSGQVALASQSKSA